MANYRAVARRAATRYGLDPNVFVRQIQQESGFRPNARSPAGALGIAQIMPGTARGWGVDPMNPGQALNAAAKNMASYVHRYGGIENALRAYNAGPGAIQASKGYAETNNYVRTILGSGPRAAAPRAPRAGTPRAASSVTGATGSESDLLGLLGALRPQQRSTSAARSQGVSSRG
jgi:soluble lytic murein transglycosylase-like protein